MFNIYELTANNGKGIYPTEYDYLSQSHILQQAPNGVSLALMVCGIIYHSVSMPFNLVMMLLPIVGLDQLPLSTIPWIQIASFVGMFVSPLAWAGLSLTPFVFYYLMVASPSITLSDPQFWTAFFYQMTSLISSFGSVTLFFVYSLYF